MPREWKTGLPLERGWYVVTGDPEGRDAGEWRSYWNGREWRGFAHQDTFGVETVIGYPVHSVLFFAERLPNQPEKPF